jgi:diguanylate cyclase (GGDEF)-like protein/PAS domain S-box-containing protein
MTTLAQNETQAGPRNARPENTAAHRRRPVCVLFVHRDADTVECCLQELKKAQFTVSADSVLTLAQCTEQLRLQCYDVVVAEYPSPSWNGSQALQLLHQTLQEIPFVFVTTAMGSEPIAQLTSEIAFDCVAREHLAQLPMAVRRVLNEKKLREELEDARRALRHSQSQYRALVDNPANGIYRCDAEGAIRDVNQALVILLGYATKEELLAANHATELLPNLRKGSTLVGGSRGTMRIEPVETEWKRKNGTTARVRISGSGVYDEHGDFVGHEIIAVDITEQRTLEEQVRHGASSDSLTGLVNHRRFLEVLQSEICRSKRTGREFSLLLLDLDGLKEINDRFGHLTGDRALCRLGQILGDCCRSIDTAARHGGDEFALVLPETSVGAATLVARRIWELLVKDKEEPMLAASVGIASYPKEANTIGTLISAADKALYAPKHKPTRAVAAGHV